MPDKLADAIYDDPDFRQALQRIARDGSVVEGRAAAQAAADATRRLVDGVMRAGTELESEVVEDEQAPERYVAVAPRFVGTLDDWRTSWGWSGQVHLDRGAAIKQGLKTFDSDDFLVGVVDPAGRVTRLLWMDEDDRAQTESELLEVTSQLRIPAATP